MLNPYTIWIAILSVGSFAVTFPPLYWYLGEYGSELPPEAQIMASLVPFALVTSFAVSWWGS